MCEALCEIWGVGIHATRGPRARPRKEEPLVDCFENRNSKSRTCCTLFYFTEKEGYP